MAADTRDDASPQGNRTSLGDGSTQVPYQEKVYEIFDGHPATPPASANMLPGGSANTAGGRQKEANLIDALRTMKLSDFTEVHKKPCARESFMTGILSAFGVGGFRAVLGGMHSSLKELGSRRLIIRANSVDTKGLELGRGDFHRGIVRGARILSTEACTGAADYGKSGRDH